MIIFLFFVFSFLTVLLSIRLSILADMFGKSSRTSVAVIGGIVLAGITALPELITCVSSILVNNPALAFGDVFGSNFFNIFMLCFFDLFYIKKYFFNNISCEHRKVYIFILINSIFILMYILGICNYNFLGIGIPSFIIFALYLIYLIKLPHHEEVSNVKQAPFIIPRIIIVSLFLVCSSTLLTISVDKISIMYPAFSSSLLGAFLLGVTTSLPEVITFFTLFKMENYDMALSDIIGSNMFNLLVLAIGDILVTKASIYSYHDANTILLVKCCILVTLINLIQMTIRNKPKFCYFLLSLLVILIYGLFFVMNFIC